MSIADLLVDKLPFPAKARTDARHVAVGAIFGVDYLMTWNCRHIADAARLPAIYSTLRDEGYEPPLIVNPEGLSNYE